MYENHTGACFSKNRILKQRLAVACIKRMALVAILKHNIPFNDRRVWVVLEGDDTAWMHVHGNSISVPTPVSDQMGHEILVAKKWTLLTHYIYIYLYVYVSVCVCISLWIIKVGRLYPRDWEMEVIYFKPKIARQ